MAARYESVSGLLSKLRKRRIQAHRELVENALRSLGLREPFGAEDLEELVAYLGPKHTVNHRIQRTERVLSGQEWADAVTSVRLELGLPPKGLSEGEARALHKALMDTLVGRPTVVWVGTKRRKPVPLFWKELIAATRRLCTQLGINPRSLDKLRASYAQRTPGILFGVRKLLDPDCVFMIGEDEMEYIPTQTDRLLGHVLWNLPLDARTMEPKPSVSFEWQSLEDGNGQFIYHIFNEKDATAPELRKLKIKMQEMKRSFRDRLLLTMGEVQVLPQLSWEERWRRWNRLFPDFAVQSPGALRKAYAYAVKNREQIMARYDSLRQPG